MDYMFSNAEWSSGCESGWTLYLENSSRSPSDTYKSNNLVEENRVQEEEEDLSMVSDASSGPPHIQEDEYYLHDNSHGGCNHHTSSIDAALPKKSGKREKKREKNVRFGEILEHPSLLDDTASSPLFDFSSKNFGLINNNQASMPNMLDFSQGYSTTHFQGKSAYQEHYNFFQSSLSENQLQQNQWYEEKRW